MGDKLGMGEEVLILVVVDDGLVPKLILLRKGENICLNPCCSGRWSSTRMVKYGLTAIIMVLILVVVDDGLVLLLYAYPVPCLMVSLNPCCSGRWSSTESCHRLAQVVMTVLILVVVDDGLVLNSRSGMRKMKRSS